MNLASRILHRLVPDNPSLGWRVTYVLLVVVLAYLSALLTAELMLL